MGKPAMIKELTKLLVKSLATSLKQECHYNSKRLQGMIKFNTRNTIPEILVNLN